MKASQLKLTQVAGRYPFFYPLEAAGEEFALARGARRLGLLFSVWPVVNGTREDFVLSVKRKMIVKLRDQHMRQ